MLKQSEFRDHLEHDDPQVFTQWLVGEGASEHLAGEILAVYRGHPPDTSEPELPSSVERPTGQEVFDSLSKEKQDEMLGPEAAEKVRKGEATLADFIEKDGGFIRQRPASDV